MRKVIFLAAVFSFIPLSIQAVETLNSVYFEGAAPIVVDGDLSDWAFVTSGPVSITNTMLNWWNKRSNTIIPIKSQNDLSGSLYVLDKLFTGRVRDELLGVQVLGWLVSECSYTRNALQKEKCLGLLWEADRAMKEGGLAPKTALEIALVKLLGS